MNKKCSVLDCSNSLVLATLAGVGCSKQLVIIDTDPGIDDALAIFTVLGNPEIKVLAITCVRGNADLPQVAVNTVGILRAAKKEGVSLYKHVYKCQFTLGNLCLVEQKLLQYLLLIMVKRRL